MLSKKGQIAFFVILAIVIVGGMILFFAFRSQLFGEKISEEFSPIYVLYDECIEQETKNALDVLGSQGGRIDTGEYFPGSDYSPLSSHLNFLGFSIPYWYSLRGNNLVTEQVPSRSDMEKDVEKFLEEGINDCDFSGFYARGFFIETDDDLDGRVKVSIEEDVVSVEVNSVLSSYIEDRSARRSSHNVQVQSKIGKFYNIARDVYNAEQNTLFLESYAVDVLQNYAPVDGVEIQCAPKIWKTAEVVEELKAGLGANIGAVKLMGSYYRLNEDEDDYFVRDIGRSVDEQVNFVYLEDNFPSKIEITPASQALMIAEPIGTQEGLGVMGFCYVSYHFVYDLTFPVLIQITDGQEVFQYPVAVVIDNNLPREANPATLVDEPEVDVCSFADGDVMVKTYDNNLNPVGAEISYNCFDNFCGLGKTELKEEDFVLDSKIPVCLNGFLIANAEGYAEKKILFSSNSESFAEIILDKEYEVEVSLRVAGKEVEKGTAVVNFLKDEGSVSVVLPSENKVKLTEGLYDVSVFSYGDSNVVIPVTRKRECFETTKGGIAGFFGGTKEECVDIELPAVKIDHALNGGGKTTTYILESDLETGKIIIDASELPKPTSLEQLQYNYEVFETLGVQLNYG